jgi:EAL domain-containing protein (putative c-di-GMP-specific phosphodiesterase class I)/GGDEF domain-containing protein/CBS domain-containing protein
MKEQVSQIRRETSEQLRKVLDGRALTTVFQPIFSFREGRILGFEALVRGPEGSAIETPFELFAAAQHAGLALELNMMCVQEILRTFARSGLEGNLFLNVSPQLIMQRGFEQERAARFMESLGLEPGRVVIELTEDYPTVDFRFVHESLMHYRAMGFRVAIDDLGEGFASLRLWSELRPEFVKADKHFVSGIATDPVKHQFLRAIQHIADNCGSLVIAEGIENAEDFRVAKDIGIACGQGWFIGMPSETPNTKLPGEAELAFADARVPVTPAARLRAGTEPTAHDFVRAVDAATPRETIASLLKRFAAHPTLMAIPVIDAGGVRGVVSRTQLELVAASPEGERLVSRPCIDLADETPIRVEADMDLAALTALLVESDARHLADGFVIVSKGRYLGMGASQDVMRALQNSRVLAARYTNPLTLLPGQVPINEHLERLLASQVPFTAWFVEVDQMRGLNDCEGFATGDALIHATARLLEAACSPGVDFVGHVSGSRFVVLMQSEDWKVRAERILAEFPRVVEGQVSAEVFARGYYIAAVRDGGEKVRPLPRLALGILPVLPGVFESRHEVVLAAKHAAQAALAQYGSAIHIDQQYGNAYPQSLLFAPD